MNWRKVKVLLIATSVSFLVLITASDAWGARAIRPEDISVPEGFVIEVAVEGLAAPTMVAFDDQRRMLVAESGYCADPEECPEGAGGAPKVTRIESDGSKTTLADAGDFGDEVPVTAIAYNDGRVYVAHAGTISVIERPGRVRELLSGLPGQGDHQVNQMVFKDGFLYFGVGTATNSGVVGPDNAVFGWLKKPELRQFHDVPCTDVTLSGAVFESENPLTREPGVLSPEGNESVPVRTSPYSAFGEVQPAGTVVKGNPKCNGAVLRVRPDGTGLEVYASGLRNPYGVEVGPDGEIYVAMHGFDARGSRPIENAWDCMYRVTQGAWYGWPDFACDRPVTESRFKPADTDQPQFLLTNHPTGSPPKPIVKFNPHAATNGFAFSPSSLWGTPETAYLALFGDFSPATGTVDRPQGVKVVKVDTERGRITDFLANKTEGQASRHSAGGLEHPSDVTFGPDGDMYIADWGIARVSVEGLKLEPNSGVVWRVSPGRQTGVPLGPSLLFAVLGTVVLSGAAFASGFGSAARPKPLEGVWTGAVAGLGMGLFTMAIAAPVLELPWYAPPRVLATMAMGRTAVANILEFDLPSFAVGVLLLLVLTVLLGLLFTVLVRTENRLRIVLSGVLFGLAVWALLQYFLLPLVFPLVTEKGFPPEWYAASFAVFGLILGGLIALRAAPRSGGAAGQ
ncbi:MAG TPA: PQQ-dependent sugar dehydrogenase [Actinomycetota bacterium]|nr:PQQ-dependent sugar dehydrogenase [Actinomycetota bacterium]